MQIYQYKLDYQIYRFILSQKNKKYKTYNNYTYSIIPILILIYTSSHRLTLLPTYIYSYTYIYT